MSIYYTAPDSVNSKTRAASAKINEVIQSVEDGFDELPADIAAALADIAAIATTGFPDQTGRDGSFLTTDGTTPSWTQNFSKAVTHSVIGTEATIDCTSGNAFTDTVTANITYVFDSPPANFYVMVLDLTNGGAYTVTFPAFEGDTPDLIASGIDKLTFITTDSGVTWYLWGHNQYE